MTLCCQRISFLSPVVVPCRSVMHTLLQAQTNLQSSGQRKIYPPQECQVAALPMNMTVDHKNSNFLGAAIRITKCGMRCFRAQKCAKSSFAVIPSAASGPPLLSCHLAELVSKSRCYTALHQQEVRGVQDFLLLCSEHIACQACTCGAQAGCMQEV